MPRETILRVLHEALSDTRCELDALIERLIGVYRGTEDLERTDHVVALGFLVCARAMRESSLMQEVAVREELQELDRLVREILESLRHTQRALDLDLERRGKLRRRDRGLVEDLRPEPEAPQTPAHDP